MTQAKTYRYSGRDFTESEIKTINNIIASNPKLHRSGISREVCKALGWYKPDGGLKDMRCRVVLLRMHEYGLVKLPPPRHPCVNKKRLPPQITAKTDPASPITEPVHKLQRLKLAFVSSQKESKLWNEYIQRYHYLGYKTMPGAQLRYFVYSHTLVALVGIGSAAWKTMDRDKFIGWIPEKKEQNLRFIVNNTRFLILPWVRSKNLASKILSMIVKQLPHDWNERYKYTPVLMETFVQKDRFEGTCYKAANWIHVGVTKGRGKFDRYNKATLPKKDIWLYPLKKNFKELLCC